jgi:hypothetical protein
MMLRKLMIVCVALSASAGVAIARPHGAAAQGAVLCGLLRLPLAAAHQGVHPNSEIFANGELPCSSVIVAEPSQPPTVGNARSLRAAAVQAPVSTVVHCQYRYDVTLTPTGADPSVLTGTGFLDIRWSDGGFTSAAVTVVGVASSAGGTALEMVGTAFGRFNGGLVSFTDVLVAGQPAQQLAIAWS